MANMSQWLANQILEWIQHITFPAAPATLYLGVNLTEPNASGGTGTEPSGGSYARVAITGGTAWSAISGTLRQISNVATISFPTASADWGTVAWWTLRDAASGAGNMVAYGALKAPVTILNGQTLQIAAGDIVIRGF